MGELPQQMDANLRMLTGLQDRLRSNESSLRLLEERRIFLETQVKMLAKSIRATANENTQPMSLLSGAQEESLTNELARKREKLAELTQRYTELVPEVVRTKQEVADLEKRIAKIHRSEPVPPAGDQNADLMVPATAPPHAVEEIRRMRIELSAATGEIASLKKEKEGIQKSIAAVEQKVEQSPRREQEMISLIRDYENQKKSYDDLQAKKLQADVSQNLEKRQKGTQFQILDPANLPEEPFKPDRKKVMGISFLIALVLGFGGAIALEMVDPTLRDARDFKHLYKVPILGYIPVVKDTKYQRVQTMRRAAVLGGLVTFTMALSIFLLVFREKIRTILNF